MSLRVWLPLTGHLDNQGVSGLTPVQTTAPTWVDGKLGKAMSTGALYLPANDVAKFYNNNAMSFAFWIYAVGSSGSSVILGQSNMSVGNNRMFTIYQYPSPNDLHLSWQSNESSTTFLGGVLYGVFPSGTWTHCAITYDGAKATVYINGVYQTSRNGVSTRTNFTYDVPIPSTSIRYLNDFRIYDHALSPKEVKLLSQGLVCHYKLDDIYATNNLIVNGYGQDGGTGWTVPANISTTEIPPDHPEIKASFYNGTESPLIPWDSGHTYTISAYLKANGSGTSYPAFRPYDIDKKYIQYFHCSMAFSNSYKTTLAQPLHKGDTVIYATDLSAWTTGDNYYYHVAIFSYKDSTGYVYPDMQYTQDCPLFGTKTDKSHIDKTNNTITLNSAYTGEDRPAGTTICQATEGSTYYYPFGGINTSTIQDWTYKTATITPYLDGRLRFAKYVRYMAYYCAYHAGIQLVDNTTNETIVYDSSGYNYHGTPASLVVSTDTPRNSLSTYFDGTTSYVEFPDLSFMPTVLPNEWTFSFWVYNQDSGNRSIFFSNYSLGGVGSYSFGFEKTAGELLRVVYANGAFDRTIPNSTFTVNAWTHIAVSKTAAHLVSVYRNGVLIDSYTNSNCASNGVLYRMGRDARSDSTMFSGKLSDFRIYATALSADDIKELYHTSASIDKDGNLYAYELKEV